MTELEQAILRAEDIAKNGTQEQKETFVAWCCESINYLSSQGDNVGVSLVSQQYKAYLRALTAQEESK